MLSDPLANHLQHIAVTAFHTGLGVLVNLGLVGGAFALVRVHSACRGHWPIENVSNQASEAVALFEIPLRNWSREYCDRT